MALLNVVCDACRRRIRVPDEFAGHRVTCPKCEQPVYVPATAADAAHEYSRSARGSAQEDELEEPFEYPDRLGMISLTLAAVSVLMLLIPPLGYAVIAASAVGLLLGVRGVVQFGLRGPRPPETAWHNAMASNPLLHIGVSLSLLGLLGCLFALGVALWPHVAHFIIRS
jgi:hypothetical protein